MSPLGSGPARPEDAAAIASIYNEGIADRTATFETAPRTAAQIAALLADRGERSSRPARGAVARLRDRGAAPRRDGIMKAA